MRNERSPRCTPNEQSRARRRPVVLHYAKQVKESETAGNKTGENSSNCLSASLAGWTESLTSYICAPEHSVMH